MNPRTRTGANVTPLFALLALVFLAVWPSWATADEPITNPTTMNFAAGGAIRLKLNKGTAEVVGVPGEKITVSWHSTFPEDERDVTVKLEGSGGQNARVVVDGPGNRMRYRIEVPQQSDVAIHMRAGDLNVHGILGSVAADLLAGNMDLRVAQPQHYRTVSASVTAGEITAPPWHAEMGGLWRSFKATGEGEYEVRARLLAGQLTIRAE